MKQLVLAGPDAGLSGKIEFLNLPYFIMVRVSQWKTAIGAAEFDFSLQCICLGKSELRSGAASVT